MITARTVTRTPTTAAKGTLTPAARPRASTGPDDSGSGSAPGRTAVGASGASGCIAVARVQGRGDAGAACPPGSSGSRGRAGVAPAVLVVISEVAAAGIEEGGASACWSVVS